MYHPGRIVKIFSPKDRNIESSDENVQATVETWDENLITFLVDPKLADKVKERDVVLIDYRPSSIRNPIPKHMVIKILKGRNADAIWKRYKDFFEKRKKSIPTTPAREQSYVG